MLQKLKFWNKIGGFHARLGASWKKVTTPFIKMMGGHLGRLSPQDYHTNFPHWPSYISWKTAWENLLKDQSQLAPLESKWTPFAQYNLLIGTSWHTAGINITSQNLLLKPSYSSSLTGEIPRPSKWWLCDDVFVSLAGWLPICMLTPVIPVSGMLECLVWPLE